jgi:hypothetical protein
MDFNIFLFFILCFIRQTIGQSPIEILDALVDDENDTLDICDDTEIYSDVLSECVSCSGPGASLDDETGECTCGLELANLVDGVCECEDYCEVDSLGHCVPCDGPGHRFENDTCSCDVGANSHDHHQNGICECFDGFLRYAKATHYGGQKIYDFDYCIPCSGPGAVLGLDGRCECTGCAEGSANNVIDESVCVCNEGFLMFENEDGFLACIPCSGPTSYIDQDGNCACAEDNGAEHSDPDTCVCESSTGTHSISEDGSFCLHCDGVGHFFEDYQCHCADNANGLESFQSVSCACDEDNDYYELGDICVFCDSTDANWENDECVCTSQHMTLQADGGCSCNEHFHRTSELNECFECFGVGFTYTQANLADSECSCDAANSHLDGSECVCDENFYEFERECHPCYGETHEFSVEGICSCGEGFLLDSTFGCVKCSGLAAHLEDDVCTCGFQQSLDDDSVCECNEGYQALGDFCIYCNGVGAQVNDETGSCVCGDGAHIDPDYPGNCICDAAHFIHSDGQFCFPCSGPGAIGVNDECTCQNDENAILFWGSVDTCFCNLGFLSNGESCIACSGPGSFLDEDSVCTCQQGHNSHFEDGEPSHCMCDTNHYLRENDGNHCDPCWGPGHLFGEDGCTCDSQISAMHQHVDGMCECLEESYLSEDGANCIPCSGVGAYFQDETCKCAHGASNIEGVCQCDAGFVQHGDRQCIQCQGIQ